MASQRRSSTANKQLLRTSAREEPLASNAGQVLQAMKNRLLQQNEFLRELVTLAHAAEPLQAEEFSALTNLAVNHYGVAARRLAEALDVAPSAISRWASGDSAPRAYARASVLSTVASLLQEQIGLLEQELANTKRKLAQPA
jgi:hypothetical protein